LNKSFESICCLAILGQGLTLGWTTSALAAKVSVLVIAEDQEGRGHALRLSSSLGKKLALAQELLHIDITEAIDPEVAAFRAQDIQDGMASAKTGLAALDQLDLETAGGDLDMAVTLLLGYHEQLSRTDRAVLDQAVFALATVSMFEGNTGAADAIFVALALLSPSYSPEVDGYALNVTKQYRRIRAGLENRPVGVVEIRSTPPGAAVYVDGKYRGVSPVNVDDLVDGQHTVILRRRGYLSHGTLTPVNAGRKSSVEVDLAPTKAVDVLKAIDTSFMSNTEARLEFARKLKLREFVVLNLRSTPSGPSVEGHWLEVATGKVLATIPRTVLVKEPDIAADTILAIIANKSDPFAAKEGDKLDLDPWRFGPLIAVDWKALPDKWWFWPVIAGAVSVAAIGTGLAISSDSGPSLPPPSQHILGF
jgi:hypothetical protein